MNRIEHIDIAKGIGIILIVASHVVLQTDKVSAMEAAIYKYWCNFLSSFYVPVFFMLSGIFETNSLMMRNYWKRILRCFKYVMIFFVWGILAYYVINGDWDIKKGALTYTPVWFLIVLLYITVLFGLIKRIRLKYQYLCIFVIGGGGYALAHTGHSYLWLGQTLLCLPFYAVGYWGKDWFKSMNFRPKVFFASLAVWIVITLLFDGEQNISLNLVNKPFVFFYTDALCGSIALIEFCKLIHSKILRYIGLNSIILMMTHLMFVQMNYKTMYIHIDSWQVWLLCVFALLPLSCCFIPLLRNKFYKII